MFEIVPLTFLIDGARMSSYPILSCHLSPNRSFRLLLVFLVFYFLIWKLLAAYLWTFFSYLHTFCWATKLQFPPQEQWKLSRQNFSNTCRGCQTSQVVMAIYPGNDSKFLIYPTQKWNMEWGASFKSTTLEATHRYVINE